jgi:ESCRT-II complex subunit VPS22
MPIRRRPGVAGIQSRQDKTVALRVVGSDLEARSLDVMRTQLEQFKASLEAFALKHKAEIRADPAFRAQFHSMCASCGVDPLASNKGFWAETLGFGDFYAELGVQIVEQCLASRGVNGGLMDLDDLMAAVLHRRGRVAQPISEDDVKRAIERLGVLGGGWSVNTIGAKTVVRSVPAELSDDQQEVIATAERRGPDVGDPGCVRRSALELEPPRGKGWSRSRADAALRELVKCGAAMIDDGDPSGGERLYWLPCVSRQKLRL